MLNVPLYILLILYSLFLVVFVGFMIANLYHINASASFTFLGTLVSLILIVAGAVVILYTFYFLSGTDWSEPLISINTDWLGGLFNGQGVDREIPSAF